MRGIVLWAEAAEAEAAEEAEVGTAVTCLGFVGEAGAGVDVGQDAEVADVGKPWVIEDRRTDEFAEARAAPEADPMAELDTVGLKFEVDEEATVEGRVSCSDGKA